MSAVAQPRVRTAAYAPIIASHPIAPDQCLDVPGKRWLEDRLGETGKTVLFVSHDRELLKRAAERIIAVEPSPAGSDVWVHGGGFGTFPEARQERFARFQELRRAGTRSTPWEAARLRSRALTSEG